MDDNENNITLHISFVQEDGRTVDIQVPGVYCIGN